MQNGARVEQEQSPSDWRTSRKKWQEALVTKGRFIHPSRKLEMDVFRLRVKDVELRSCADSSSLSKRASRINSAISGRVYGQALLAMPCC